MAKCGLCEKIIYATTTVHKAVFDAYCISCRGLFNLYTYRGMTEQQAKDTIFVSLIRQMRIYSIR